MGASHAVLTKTCALGAHASAALQLAVFPAGCECSHSTHCARRAQQASLQQALKEAEQRADSASAGELGMELRAAEAAAEAAAANARAGRAAGAAEAAEGRASEALAAARAAEQRADQAVGARARVCDCCRHEKC